MPNDGPPGHVLPPNVALSRGNHSPLQPGMPGRDDLKNLASHYLHNISSYVDKVRMRQSQSSTVKVLILLEIEEQYAPVIPVRALLLLLPLLSSRAHTAFLTPLLTAGDA